MTQNFHKSFIIDFDSTFTRVEALDELCEISLKDNPEKDSILQQIISLTDKGMSGEISFRESLEKRILLVNAHRDHIPELVDKLSKKITKSFIRNNRFSKNIKTIYI